MITLSIILAVVLTASFFIIRNLIKRNESQEDMIEEYENFIIKQSEAINACDQRLKEIDREKAANKRLSLVRASMKGKK